jgi:hypothetical protein
MQINVDNFLVFQSAFIGVHRQPIFSVLPAKLESLRLRESLMTEEELDSLHLPPFGTAEALQMEARQRRFMRLGIALWGKTAADLQRQLLAPHPEIPSGFEMADFRKLQQITEALAAISRNTRLAWLPRSAYSSTIFVDTQRLTTWEARCEVVRRAIGYLGNLPPD